MNKPNLKDGKPWSDADDDVLHSSVAKGTGWAAGVNAQFDERWTGDNMDLIRAAASNAARCSGRLSNESS
jgi:hypothetical protein